MIKRRNTHIFYAADGRKLQENVASGSLLSRRDYVGDFIYETGVLKRIMFEGGYVYINGSSRTYMFFLKDHLGSVRAVVAQTGAVQQTNEYYPFGDLFPISGTDNSGNRFRFTGKELGDETGLYDFSARFLHPRFGRFTTLDPLAEKYPSVSPYAYCNCNPVRYIDPDGMDWYAYYHGRQDRYENMLPHMSYAWTDARSQDELDALGIQGTYLGEAVVVFDGFYDEKLGSDGTLTGEGAKPANVTIYGINGSDDVSHYYGLTVSSDPDKYSMLQNGEYRVFHQQMETSVYGRGSLTYRISDLEGNLDLSPAGDINKFNGTSVMTEIFLHRTDSDGRATRSSVGCLVIDGRSWKDVERQLGTASNIYLKLMRQ
ncbi:MAG: RHS repeat-associated core domain-containing protein [Bacteroidales bacterium]|nr:RHS repeat-associated core domain-containing protein [Bacteroidales bacterium]